MTILKIVSSSPLWVSPDYRNAIYQSDFETYTSHIHPHEKVTVSFLIFGFVFNLEYLSQFILKYLNEGQYQNCHEEQISKLSPIFLFCRKLTEIFKVKDNARNQKRYRYFFVWVYIKSNNQGQFCNMLILRIPKLFLFTTFDKDITEM